MDFMETDCGLVNHKKTTVKTSVFMGIMPQ
jgi:hypothetical protein